MSKTSLPTEIIGGWIWDKSRLKCEDSYIFTRKTFALDQSGVDAQFWISANYSYQLFVNGRFIGNGPSPAPPGISYADYYDLSYYLLTGKNVIAIVAHHMIFPTYSQGGKQPGLWCQLNIDGKPTLGTDANWKIHSGDCYQQSRPRKGRNLEFCEVCDLSKYPRGWRSDNYLEMDWEYCNYDIPVKDFPSKLEAMPFDTPEFEEMFTPWKIVSRGTLDPKAMIGQVHFSDVITRPGTYAARSYVMSDDDTVKNIKLYADSPCRVFVNDVLTMIYEPDKEVNCQEYETSLKQGWNEILVVQTANPSSMGALLAFPDEQKGDVKFFTEPRISANDGWKVYGPFRKTMTELLPSITHDFLLLGECRTERALLNDGQAYLDGCRIENLEFSEKDTIPRTLNRYEFYVFDIGKLHYGFPGISISGKAGDIVDICYGETLNELKIPKNNDNYRSVDTLKIRSGGNNWMKFEPVCFRYVMISTRKCAGDVQIDGMFVVHYSKDYRKNSEFSCSDQELNNIWGISRYLSLLSSKTYFIGIPYHRKTQYLGDACIQSRNSYYLFSDYSLNRKAITEYARSQYEDGSIPITVSGLPDKNHIDQMMLFPLWVQEYYKFSGDKKLMLEMLPHIERLLQYFSKLLNPGSGLLEDFDAWQNIAFFGMERVELRSGMITSLNALYCRTLFSAAQMYDHAGNDQQGEVLRMQASKVAGKVRKLTYNSKLKCYADFAKNGKMSEECSLYSNIMALYSGIALPEQANDIFKRFFSGKDMFKELSSAKMDIIFRSLFLDTLYAYGKSDLALAYLRHCYRETAKDKALTPGLALDRTLFSNSYMIQEIAGLRIASPGFSTIYFCPDIKAASRVKIVFPTTYGKIKIDWKLDEDGTFTVKIDANYPLEVVPQLPPEVEGKTTLMLGKSVVVLDPDSGDE